jgi:hypothetical protein
MIEVAVIKSSPPADRHVRMEERDDRRGADESA